jgi:uncharacterized protein (TIGR02217 family)
VSNAIFPTLIGEAWPRVKVPRFSNQKATSDSLRSWRVARAVYPLYAYKLTYAYLSAADKITMEAFFKARKGDFDSFLLYDRDDNAVVTPQVLGIGDGVTRSFQLIRSLGGVVEPVGPLNGSPVIRVNGVATGAYAADNYGLITFTAAPPAGQTVDWTGSFYWRCCFVKSEAEFSEFMRQFWELKSIDLETEKP